MFEEFEQPPDYSHDPDPDDGGCLVAILRLFAGLYVAGFLFVLIYVVCYSITTH